MSRRVVVGCVAVLSFAVIAPAAPAQAKRFNSSVTIDDFYCGNGQPPPKRGGMSSTPCSFVGFVNSGHAKCKRDRKVKLFFGSDLVGSDHTSRNGFWGIRRPPADIQGGIYHAKVTRRVLPNGDICKADRSPDFHLV